MVEGYTTVETVCQINERLEDATVAPFEVSTTVEVRFGRSGLGGQPMDLQEPRA